MMALMCCEQGAMKAVWWVGEYLRKAKAEHYDRFHLLAGVSLQGEEHAEDDGVDVQLGGDVDAEDGDPASVLPGLWSAWIGAPDDTLQVLPALHTPAMFAPMVSCRTRSKL